MGEFDDAKPKPKEETLKEALEFLHEARFNFACFVDSFERYLKKAGILQKDENST